MRTWATLVIAAMAILAIGAGAAQGATLRITGQPEVGATLRAQAGTATSAVSVRWQARRAGGSYVSLSRGPRLRLSAALLGQRIRALPVRRADRASRPTSPVRPAISGQIKVGGSVRALPGRAATQWQVWRAPRAVLQSADWKGDGSLAIERPTRARDSGLVMAITLPEAMRTGSWAIRASSPGRRTITGTVRATCTESQCRTTARGLRVIARAGARPGSLGQVRVHLPAAAGIAYRTTVSGRFTGTGAAPAMRWRSRAQTALVGRPLAVSWTVIKTGASLRIPAEEAGLKLRARVPANGRWYLSATTVIPLAALSAPGIEGEMRIGGRLTGTPGTWAGPSSSMSQAYRWQVRDGASWRTVGGDSRTMMLSAEDEGKMIRLCVVASAPGTSETACSAEMGPVVRPAEMNAPLNDALPVITGTLREGSLLAASDGAWRNCAPCSFAYQWQRAPEAGGEWLSIDAARGATYQLRPVDIGTRLRVLVIARNAYGETQAISAATEVIDSLLPIPASPPVISGTPKVGAPITATPGRWFGQPVLSYQWEVLVAGEWTAASGAGATTLTYEPVLSDMGMPIRIVARGENTLGSASEPSEQTPPVLAPDAPSSLTPPAVSGTAQAAQTLTGTDGVWAGIGMTLTRSWLACDALTGACTPLGETGTSLVLTAAMVGKVIVLEVTATNPGGETTARSVATTAVLPAPPVNTQLPEVTGTAQSGEVLFTSDGSWTNDPTQFAYQWEVAPQGSSDWQPAPGEGDVSASYTPTDADAQMQIRVVVTASNAGGSGQAASAVQNVLPRAPENIIPPTLSGTIAVRELVEVSVGRWERAASYACTWSVSEQLTGPWTPAPGESQGCGGYIPAAADEGKRLQVTVTATNPGGDTIATSDAAMSQAIGPPVPYLDPDAPNAGAPEVAGWPRIGAAISGSPGSWLGSPTLTCTWQVQSSGGEWETGAGVQGSCTGYTPDGSDAGKLLRLQVLAQNATGSGQATSAATMGVVPIPVLTSPAAQVAVPLSVNPGAWYPTPVLDITWQVSATCNPSDDSWETGTGTGATSATYTPGEAEQGLCTRAVVNAAYGSETQRTVTIPSPRTLPPPVPTIDSRPTVSGSTRVWTEQTATTGAWLPAVSTTYAYQWKVYIDGQGYQPITPLSRSQSETFEPLPEDEGKRIIVSVTASNAGGSSQPADSDPFVVTAPLPPVNLTGPQVTGRPQVGQPLASDDGTWERAISFEYQWQSRTTPDGAWSDITGATRYAYAPTEEMLDRELRICVVGKNSGGDSAPSCSAATIAVLPANPEVIDTAEIAVINPEWAGSETRPIAAETTVIGTGTWTNEPTSYLVTWQSADSPTATTWTNVGSTETLEGGGAMAAVVNPGDVPGMSISRTTTNALQGKYLRAKVTAINAGGSTTVYTQPTGKVIPNVPKVVTAPTISGLVSGEPRITSSGSRLDVNVGSWTYSPTTYAYSWKRSGSSTSISPNSFYTPSAADWRKSLQVCIVAYNGYWTSVADGSPATCTSQTAIAKWSPPVYQSGMYATGGMTVGDGKGSTPGTWSNNPQSYTYSWQTKYGEVSSSASMNIPQPSDIDLTLCITANGPDYSGAQQCQNLGNIAPRVWNVNLSQWYATGNAGFAPTDGNACQFGASVATGSGCWWRVDMPAGTVITEVVAPGVARYSNFSTGSKTVTTCVGGTCGSNGDGWFESLLAGGGAKPQSTGGWSSYATVGISQSRDFNYGTGQIMYVSYGFAAPYAVVRDAPG